VEGWMDDGFILRFLKTCATWKSILSSPLRSDHKNEGKHKLLNIEYYAIFALSTLISSLFKRATDCLYCNYLGYYFAERK
jgi:hypothetical protein